MSPATITIIITVIMAILFLSGKFAFGLSTMACCAALVLTGVLSVGEAFGGLSNQIVVMVASMFCLSTALQKTDVAFKLKGAIAAMSGKSNMILVVTLFGVYFLLLLFMPGIVVMSIMVTFLDALPETGEVTPGRILIPMLMFNTAWEGAIPLGMGATADFTANGYFEKILEGTWAQGMLFEFGNNFMLRLFPAIGLTLYALFIWKMFPKNKVDTSKLAKTDIKESTMPKNKQKIVYAVFIVVMAILVLNKVPFLGKIMWVAPACGVLVLGFLNVMTPKELVAGLGADVAWMIAGVLGVTTALTKTGAAEIIGKVLWSLVSWTDNGFLILLITGIFAGIMTTFLSNSGVSAALTPLVASMAVAGHMDPRAIVGITRVCSNYAYIFPSGSTTCAVAFAASQQNPFKVIPWTFLGLVIAVVLAAVGANFMFPI